MASLWKDNEFQKQLLLLNGLVPGLMLAFDWYRGNLGANPPEAFIRTTGVIAILFLVLALSVTPLSQKFKWPWLLKHRRWLGLWSFYYGCLHFLGYSFFEHGFQATTILADIKKRPFILLGFTGFLLMAPLAITSSNQMIKKIGPKRWKVLHQLTYVIAIVVAIHYWMIVKSDIFYPAIFATGIAGLLLYRLIARFKTH
jgi:sulfoxide reductase heme-binding subunit YedZ